MSFPHVYFKEENKYDKVRIGKPPEQDDNIKDETGFQRLKRLFRLDNEETLHPCILVTLQTMGAMMILGGAYGGVRSSRDTFIDFLEKNEATQFLSQHDAKRRLADKMFTSFMSGGVKLGSKAAFFAGTLTFTYNVIALYENKDTPFYYIPAGAVAGGLYKFPLGPKGMVAGAVFGGFFGGIYAIARWTMIKAADFTEERYRELGVKRSKDREEAIAEAFRRVRKKKEETELNKAMDMFTK